MTVLNKIRNLINCTGFDIVRLNKMPRKTLLGLSVFEFKTIIDVGANKGQFAREISTFFPAAQLYCFEPLEEPFRVLSEYAATQGSRLRCFNVALGESSGKAKIHQHDEHSPSSSMLASTETCHEIYPQTRAEHLANIKIMTMDEVLGDILKGTSTEILLKLDVQGFEDRVLRGATKSLTYCSSIILEVCVEPLYQTQADFRVVTELLYDAGFKYVGNLTQAYGQNGRVLYLDAVFSR